MDITKIIHLSAILFLFLGLGFLIALKFANDSNAAPLKKMGTALHGLGLLLLLVTGILLIFNNQGLSHIWMSAKVVLWLMLGAALSLIKRSKLSAVGLSLIVLILGASAIFVAISKPF